MTTAAIPHVAARPRWITRVSWVLSALPVLILLSSAWVRATQRTNAISEIVASYGYPESAITRIVIAECVLVALYLIPRTSALIPLVAGMLAWGVYT